MLFSWNSKEYWESVQYLEKVTGYKVIVIPVRFNAYLQKYETRPETSPKEFIGLIKNEKLVLTDSFHGIVFSLKFEKDFFVFRRFKDKNKWGQNSRIYNILEMVNLQDRLIDINRLKNIKINYFIENYDEVNQLLNKKIDDSITFLMNALNDNKIDKN